MRIGIFRIDPDLRDLNVLWRLVLGRDGDEVRHHIDDVVPAIRARDIGAIIIDQPAAVPDRALARLFER